MLNDLSDLKIVRGAVGSRLSGEAEFHVNSSHIASSLSGQFNPRAGRPRPQTIERVSYVDVLKEWRKYFGDQDIDLMKVDIEGAEIDFLSAHSDLLARTSNVIVEWHKWIVDYATLDEVMRRHGFLLDEVPA